MGRGTYNGGGTIVRTSYDGTLWSSSDIAESKRKNEARKRDRQRYPSKREIELETQRDDNEQRKIIRSFISQCVTAYAANQLTESKPLPPRSLGRQVINIGGNIKWLQANRRYQVLFHEAYCRLIKQDIPFARVWAQHKNKH
jgi:hypothetical protein